jgi:hypothetical protein
MSKLALTPWDIVRRLPFEAGGFLDANPAAVSDESIQLFIDENGGEKVARVLRNTVSQKTTIKDFLPSLYTGGMRKLMQVSHLRGQNEFYGARHNLFLPNWSDTYGVFVGSAQDDVCPRWIIRISSAGIFRIPITFARDLPESWESDQADAMELSAEEAAEQVGRYWSAGDFNPSLAVQIGDANEMYGDYSAFYLACGWAFDGDGHQAVNTAWRSDPSDGTHKRLLSALFKVTITEADGVPSGATCALIEEGRLVNPLRDDNVATENNAILQVPTEIPGVCQTFECWPGFSNMGGDTSVAPVFAYYDSGDTLRVAHYDFDGRTTAINSSTGPDLPSPASVSSTQVGDTEIDYGMSLNPQPGSRVLTLDTKTIRTGSESATSRFSSMALGASGKCSISSYTHKSYVLGGSGVINESGWNVSIYGYNRNTITGKEGRNNYGFNNFGWATRCAATRYMQETEESQEAVQAKDVLILHGYDRTSYIHYRSTVTTYSDRDIAINFAPFALGDSEPEIEFSTGAWEPVGGPAGEDVVGYQYNATAGQIITARSYIVSGPTTTRTDPDATTTQILCKLVVDNHVLDLDYSGDTAADELYLNSFTFNYTASCSWFQTGRMAYDTDLNGTATSAGFGYGACQHRLHAFLGAF